MGYTEINHLPDAQRAHVLSAKKAKPGFVRRWAELLATIYTGVVIAIIGFVGVVLLLPVIAIHHNERD